MFSFVTAPTEIEAELFDRSSNTYVPATVISSLNENSLSELDSWPSMLAKLLHPDGRPWSDSRWSWREFINKASWVHPNLKAEFYVVQCQGEIQGALMIVFPRQSMRVNPIQKQVLYVAKLSTHPRNRRHLIPLMGEQKFKGVGNVLMQVAGARSSELGMNGCVSLLSVKRAVDFYRDVIGMQSYANEVDDEEGLHYFEDRVTRGYTL